MCLVGFLSVFFSNLLLVNLQLAVNFFLAIARQGFLFAVCRLNFFGHDSVAWWLQWRVRDSNRMEGNEQLYAQKVSDCVKDFVLRYNIDEAAAVALRSLPLGQQQEVTSQITGATNPSAVLLSRIKRLKQGQPPLNRAPVAGGAAVAAVSPEATAATGLAGVPAATAAPPPPPDDTRAAVEAFLERHCINADACQSIWELSPEQQRLVISSDLVPTTGDAFDALMDRISEILQGSGVSKFGAAKIHKISGCSVFIHFPHVATLGLGNDPLLDKPNSIIHWLNPLF